MKGKERRRKEEKRERKRLSKELRKKEDIGLNRKQGKTKKKHNMP